MLHFGSQQSLSAGYLSFPLTPSVEDVAAVQTNALYPLPRGVKPAVEVTAAALIDVLRLLQHVVAAPSVEDVSAVLADVNGHL